MGGTLAPSGAGEVQGSVQSTQEPMRDPRRIQRILRIDEQLFPDP